MFCWLGFSILNLRTFALNTNIKYCTYKYKPLISEEFVVEFVFCPFNEGKSTNISLLVLVCTDP